MVMMTLILGSCAKTSKTTTSNNLESILPLFDKGFTLTGYDSRYNRDIGRLDYGEKAEVTDWRIGQWGCTKNLVNSTHIKDGEADIYNDGSKILTIMNNGNFGFILDIDGSKDYVRDREAGEAWIHFILEVPSMPNKVKLSSINSIEFYLEFTLTKEINNNINYRPDLHTALFIWYLALKDLNPDSKGYGDYYWFGLPIYDYRYDYSPLFAAQDSGKEDRTNQFIVNPDGHTFLNTVVTLNEKQYLQYDAYQAVKDAYDLARSRGFMKDSAFEDLAINNIYIGWELPGNFDVSMTVDQMSLKAGKI